MTEAKHLLDQIVRGLDGVTGGKWTTWPNSPFVVREDTHNGWQILAHLHRSKDEVVRNAEHIACCSPDAIREIDAYVRDLERERDEARSTSVGDWANQRENDHLTIKFYEMKDRATAAEATVTALQEALAKAAEALEPFNTDWATEDGWTDYACQNDRVVDWFGPSDFRRAAAVLSQIRSEK